MTTKAGQVTAEQVARRSLRRRASRVAKLVRDASDVVLILDLDGNILSVNDAAMRKYGYTQREARRLSVRDLVPEDQEGRMITLLDEAAQGKPIESIQCQRVAKDGRVRDMWLTITPLRLNSDLPVAVMTTETEHGDADHAIIARGQLVDRLLKAHEEERRMLAHELHDETGQLVTALLQRLQKIEDSETLDAVRSEIPAVRELAEDVLREVKRIARGLRPGELDVLGLHQALQGYIEDYGRTYPVTVDAHLQGLDGQRLPSEIEVCLFRIVQEALTNAAKYADAVNISVIVTHSGGKVSMIIEDDGCGFDADRVMSGMEQAQGLGLHGIRERARAAGGDATIESSPGHGTTVYVTIPTQR